ncbi:MAG: MlaD family protein [Myxococcota bacterium]
MEISLGLLVLAALAVLAFIAVQTGHLKGIAFQVRAQVVFDDAAGLVEGAAVRVAGVQVGRVERLTVEFDQARAILLLDASADIRQDARALVRARSLLGEKYVELLPQTRSAPPIMEGTLLTSVPAGLEIDQVMGQLGPLLQQLDVRDVGPLLSELRGTVTDNRANLTRSVEQLQALLTRLESVEFDDPQLQQDIKVTAQNLRRLSASLPGTLERTEKVVQDVVGKTTPVLERLDHTLTLLEPTLQALPSTVTRLNQTLEGVDQVMRDVGPMLTRTEHINYDLMKKLLREEGLLIRFRPEEVKWSGDDKSSSSQPIPMRDPADEPPRLQSAQQP